MKRERPTLNELDAWVKELSQSYSDEDKVSIQETIEHAQKFGMAWEVMWWAYVRRNDEDFNLRICLHQGLQEWDL